MPRIAKLGSILVVFSLLSVGSAEAQQAGDHTITNQELRSAVGAEVDAEATDRALLRKVLSSETVRSVGGNAGLDVERAQESVDLLDAGELDRLASLAADVDEQLAGGQSTVTITTTTLIVVLLVLIIILVS